MNYSTANYYEWVLWTMQIIPGTWQHSATDIIRVFKRTI